MSVALKKINDGFPKQDTWMAGEGNGLGMWWGGGGGDRGDTKHFLTKMPTGSDQTWS